MYCGIYAPLAHVNELSILKLENIAGGHLNDTIAVPDLWLYQIIPPLVSDRLPYRCSARNLVS